MNIVSWNVNGLRAIHRKGNFAEVLALDADVICFQETKSEKDQLSEEVHSPKGYHGFFHSSSERKGYSGVAIYSKKEPTNVVYGLPKKYKVADTQGRVLTAHFPTFICVTCYAPNGGRQQERLEYKLDFYDAFIAYIEDLKAEGIPVVVSGDLNVAHEEIDLARPKENEGHTGFLPEERAWFDEVIASGWADVFRAFYPTKRDAYTYWDTVTRARDRNIGWRIDYILVPTAHLDRVEKIAHLSDMYGSDHCPVVISLKV